MRRAAAILALAVACCGGAQHHRPAPADQARATVQRYLAALGRGDAAAACREFTPESREKLAEFGEERLRMRPGSCRRVVARVLRSPAGAALQRLGAARISTVSVRRDGARVSVAGLDRPTEVMRDADGAWRIRSEPTGETD